jgi:hypothetical protein
MSVHLPGPALEQVSKSPLATRTNCTSFIPGMLVGALFLALVGRAGAWSKALVGYDILLSQRSGLAVTAQQTDRQDLLASPRAAGTVAQWTQGLMRSLQELGCARTLQAFGRGSLAEGPPGEGKPPFPPGVGLVRRGVLSATPAGLPHARP